MSNLKLEDYQGISTVSRARASDVATIVLSSAHNLITGDTVTITGLGGTGYNDTDVEITVVDSTTFSYANTGADETTTEDKGGLVSHTLTFPYNPNNIDFSTDKFVDNQNLPYSFNFIGMTNPVKSSINISLNGHFSGTNKNSDYRKLVRMINSNKLLKLYFENSHDKFYLCHGTNIKKVPTGLRPLHIDYVANLFCPIGILLDSTQKSGGSTSSNSNQGDMATPIEMIKGSVSTTTQVEIKDKNKNGFKFLPSVDGDMVYYLIRLVTSDNSIYYTEFHYVLVGSTPQVISNADISGNLLLELNAGESLNELFSGDSIINGITPTFYFRDGWASD